MSSAAEVTKVLVTGDVVADHHVYMGARSWPDSRTRLGTTIVQRLGGAALLYELVSDTLAKGPDRNGPLAQVDFGLDVPDLNALPSSLRSFLLWKPCNETKAPGMKDPRKVWRVDRKIGYGDADASPVLYAPFQKRVRRASIVVIDDAGLGLRVCRNEGVWPPQIRDNDFDSLDWVILKMASPLAKGDLWHRLAAHFASKLIVVAYVDDVRLEETGISQGLSWERTAEELVRELRCNPQLRALSVARHLVVPIGGEGALWVKNGGGAAAESGCSLVFDRRHVEGEWSQRIEGSAIGRLASLVAGITYELSAHGSEADMIRGLDRGLRGLRALTQLGHGPAEAGQTPCFPSRKIAEEIRAEKREFGEMQLPGEGSRSFDVQRAMVYQAGGSRTLAACGVARQLALRGLGVLRNTPTARFGKILSIDRQEIESLRGLERLISGYKASPKVSQPLSIGVFGAPGSGKSFAVKQIAQKLAGGSIPVLEFNLSQFAGAQDLIGALHQVRDLVLEGDMPFVFWDEFDSREYVWLQYFLAPMQDGKFQEGQVTHRVGKCVFVFAGGTSYTKESFGPPPKSPAFRDFALKKGPDFVSRLAGYLNVLGPNRRQKGVAKPDGWQYVDDPTDSCFPLRRAILLRAALGLDDDQEMQIDRGMLTAFLEIGQYEHGARSLMTLVSLCRANAGERPLLRCDLPARDSVSLHVDYDSFVKLVEQDLAFRDKAGALAPVVHGFYQYYVKTKKLPATYQDEFESLPPDIKGSNEEAARRIPDVLYLCGLAIAALDDPRTLDSNSVVKILEDNLETLAEAEHDGWMRERTRAGWVCGPRDDDARAHPLLKPYAQLTEGERSLDRQSIQSYPEIVGLAGYKIVRSSPA